MGKNGVKSFLKKKLNKIWTTNDREGAPQQKASTRGPLSIDIIGFSIALKMADFKIFKKLKNRDLIQNPFINQISTNFIKL